MIKIKVPARICFFGDHQDYLDLPVIAGTIDRYIYFEGVPNTSENFRINLPDIESFIEISLEDKLTAIKRNDYFRSAMAVLKKNELTLTCGFDVTISGNIPVNAGLSSSSALVVGWIRFLIAAAENFKTVSDSQIGKWAYESEVLFFNQPGGLMDQYTIALGGLIYIDTKSGDCTALNSNLGTLIVAESGLAKKTLTVLKNASVYAQKAIQAVIEQHTDFDIHTSTIEDYEKYFDSVPEKYQPYWYAAIHNYALTLKAKKMLLESQPDAILLGQWMLEHQDILQHQIQNTPKAMIQMIDAAVTAGALGAKVIGSGGGGCIVAMATPVTKTAVINALLSAGAAAAYEVQLTHH